LLSRRLLNDLKIADKFKGVENIDGEYFDIMAKEVDQRPFKAYLDVGLIRTTTGNRIFGVLKGAADGGIYVPHNNKRFPGHHLEKAQETKGKKGKVVEKGKAQNNWNPKEHRDHIFGLHVQGYMDHLKKEKKEKFKLQFSKWEACMATNKVTSLEALYKKVHAEIRKAPARVKVARKAEPVKKVISKAGDKAVIRENSKGKKWIRSKKLSNAERKKRVEIKILAATKKASKGK
jgi:large subunit ribosomal protein L5e